MLRIPKSLIDEMIAHLQEEAPNECCGILSGANQAVSKLYRITNTKRSPVRYLMDPQEQVDAIRDTRRNNWEILAFYHSHLRGPANPSKLDVEMAVQAGWWDVCYIVVSAEDESNPRVRAFEIKETGEVVEQRLQISGWD